VLKHMSLTSGVRPNLFERKCTRGEASMKILSRRERGRPIRGYSLPIAHARFMDHTLVFALNV